ncbi:hypothetical protein JTB14_021322 [Gonioctena quinquepunctata]|nr:hypothetical protein JTB14_021322 [Gonioctena quinquepunctata]
MIAYGRVAAIEKAVKGFATAGVYPLDPNIFDGDYPDFADQLENEQQPSTCNDPLDTHSAVSLGDHSRQEPLTSEVNGEHYTSKISEEPSTSKIRTAKIQLVNMSLHKIAPLPRATTVSKSNGKQGRKKQKSEILTSTPIKDVLEEKQKKKERKRNRQPGKSSKAKEEKIRNVTKKVNSMKIQRRV